MIARNQRLLANIQELAPDITSRAAEIEAGRRIPPDLVEALRSIGIFRMFVPQSHGGLELDLPAALEIFEALSRIDGSVGWISMIGGAHGMFAPLLPRNTYQRVYQDGPDVIIAGSAQPVGIAEAVAGGWRVNGRWPFASGCQHAEWMFGFCVMTEGGKPLPGPAGEGGSPLVRGVFLPARDWQSEDTWHVPGLKGTGSHHIKAPSYPANAVLIAEDLAPSDTAAMERVRLWVLRLCGKIGTEEDFPSQIACYWKRYFWSRGGHRFSGRRCWVHKAVDILDEMPERRSMGFQRERSVKGGFSPGDPE